MRSINETQEALLNSQSTKPTYLLELSFDALEYLSTNGDVTLSDITYLGSDVGVKGADDWAKATLSFIPSASRTEVILSGGWTNNMCKIYLLPRVSFPLIYDETYVEESYGVQGESFGTPILLLDGVLTSSSMDDGSLTINVSHRALVGQWTPRLRINSTFANHLPQAGTQFVWEGDNYTLEAR